MATFDLGTWIVEMSGSRIVQLSSLRYGPSETDPPEVVWEKMIPIIHQDEADEIDLPPIDQWAAEVVDAKLDGSGPRLSYLSVVWTSVAENYTKAQHRAAVQHLMRLRKYRNLTWNDYRRMNLPQALVGARLDLTPEAVRQPLRRYIESIDRWISKGAGFLFTGSPRAGKSACAAILAKAAVSRGHTAYFTRVSELRDAMKNDTAFTDDITVWGRCREVAFLVLDNLVAEDATLPYFNAAAMTDLICFRGERGRSTVLTSQIDMKLTGSAASFLVPLLIPGTAFNAANELQKEILGGKSG